MTGTAATAIERLAAYLQSCGGADRSEFYDADGNPDPVAARAHAEALRERHAAILGTVVSVEQSAHRVTLRLLVIPAHV